MIRPARPDDAAQIAAIYDHYARTTSWTFAERGPEAARYAEAIARGDYPFLVWENAECVAGFACAEPFRPHDAYRWDVELTLYLRPDCTGRGMGARLMKALLTILQTQGYLTAYSCITSSNAPSLALHRRLGFAALGEFPQTGFKHGQWHGVTWMQYTLGEFTAPPQEPLPVRTLAPQALSDILKEADE